MSEVDDWRTLFGEAGVPRSFRAVKKHGRLLLLLPENRGAAAQCLALYPAQTRFAKLAKAALGTAIRIGVPGILSRQELCWDDAAPLPAFIRAQAGAEPFECGFLLGNPRAEGRRWIIAVLIHGRLSFVVKAGCTQRGNDLISAEIECLRSLPASAKGCPTLRGTLLGPVSALALDFVGGTSPPAAGVEDRVAEILGSWLQHGHQFSLVQTAAWQEVRRSAPADLVALAETRCTEKPFTAAIMHGDFAPWNIRAAGDHWTVIDWERGCLLGIPGWDWFHYWIQSNALVARKTECEILARLEQLIVHPAFQTFATRAGIQGRERGFIFAYLLHAVFVLRQTEGLATIEALLAKLAK